MTAGGDLVLPGALDEAAVRVLLGGLRAGMAHVVMADPDDDRQQSLVGDVEVKHYACPYCQQVYFALDASAGTDELGFAEQRLAAEDSI